MLPDFELIIREFPERKDLKLYPISDVHLGAKEHMQRQWEMFCQNILADPCAYLTLGGDLINNATRSSVSNVFDDTMRPAEQKKVMAKMLEPLRDRILCITPGNHERRSRKDADDDPTYDIACKLDIEDRYRENIAFLKLRLGDPDGDGSKNPTYTVAVSHGAGGGIYTGAAVNRNERFGYIIDGLDLFIVGHSHKPFVTQPGKIYVDKQNNRVSIKPFKVVTATSWLDYGGYAAQKLLLPATHCLQTITLCGTKKDIAVTM